MERRSFFKQLAYYPKNQDGTWQPRPRVANYCKMEYSGGHAMKFESERLNTFQNWPANKDYIKPSDLAKAGFYYAAEYTRQSDRVKCAFCRGILHSWEIGDVPIKEHRRAFSTCPFILSMETGNIPIQVAEGYIPDTCSIPFEYKKPFTLSTIKQTVVPYIASTCMKTSYNSISYTVDPPILMDSEQLTRKDSWVIYKTKELGFNVDVINYVTSYFKYFNGNNYLSLDLFIHHMLDLKVKMSICIHRDDLSEDSLFLWKTFIDQQRLVQKKDMVENFKKLCIKVKDEVPIFINNITTIDKCESILQYHSIINDSLLSDEKCKICFNNNMDVIIIPCHHLVSCMYCTNQLSECPICRYPIENTLQINSNV